MFLILLVTARPHKLFGILDGRPALKSFVFITREQFFSSCLSFSVDAKPTVINF
jgi:hypothetical protein